jgi:hypothetical protein
MEPCQLWRTGAQGSPTLDLTPCCPPAHPECLAGERLLRTVLDTAQPMYNITRRSSMLAFRGAWLVGCCRAPTH